MKVAIVGIQGLPNQYGGFETLSEFLVKYLGNKVDFTIYCSSVDQKGKPLEYKGAKLKYYNITSHGGKGILFDCISLVDAVRGDFDVIVILGFGPGFVMPFLSKKTKDKIILNFGGLDWKRDKWSKKAQQVIKTCEKLLVRNSKIIVSDNSKIQDYVTESYHKPSELIAYGGNQAHRLPVTEELVSKYPFLKAKYAFEVARIQSDNNIEMLMQAFIKADKYPLVLVGNWNSTEYGRSIKAKYEHEKNLILLDAIYDKSILDVLRTNCYVYVHGHSAGGTNPSLCEAMYLGLPILAFSNGYNQGTTHNEAIYFKNADELARIICEITPNQLSAMQPKLKAVADACYRWEFIAEEYYKLFKKIANRN